MKKLLITALVASLALSACTDKPAKPAENAGEKTPTEVVANEAEVAANDTTAKTPADGEPKDGEGAKTDEGKDDKAADAPDAQTQASTEETTQTAEQKAPEDQKY